MYRRNGGTAAFARRTALVRWRPPEFDMLDPVRASQGMAKCGVPHLPPSVNLSSKYLRNPDLVERIAEVLRETGMG